MVSVRMSLHRSSALSSRAGRSLGRRRPANIRLSTGVPRRLRPNLKPYFVILSGAKNLFPLRTKGRLRTMPSKEEKDKRSAVKYLYADDTDSSSLCSSE